MAQPPTDGCDDALLTVLAYLSAYRRLLVHLLGSRLQQMPEPLAASRVLRQQFAGSPTPPSDEGSLLDPATSDLLAAMTDEAIDDLLDEVMERLDNEAERVPATPSCQPARRA